VIECTHDDPHRPGAGERHRLITDLLNPDDLPARAPVGRSRGMGRGDGGKLLLLESRPDPDDFARRCRDLGFEVTSL
jgi:hypothetical protein